MSELLLDRIGLKFFTHDDLGTFLGECKKMGDEHDVPGYLEHDVVIRAMEMAIAFEDARARDPYARMGNVKREADRERDQSYSSFLGQLNVYAKSKSNSDKREASKQLLDIINIEKPNLSANYNKQTEQFKRLIERLSTSKAKILIELTELEDMFELMKSDHLHFDNVFRDKNRTIHEIRTTKSATFKRPEMHDAIKDLLRLITANRSLPKWDMLYNDMLETLKAIITSIKLRQANKK